MRRKRAPNLSYTERYEWHHTLDFSKVRELYEAAIPEDVMRGKNVGEFPCTPR